MTEQTAAPVLDNSIAGVPDIKWPVETGRSHTDSAAKREAFAKLTAHFAANPAVLAEAAGPARNAQAEQARLANSAAPESSTDHATKLINDAQAAVGPDGKRHWDTNQKFRRTVENLRFEAAAGTFDAAKAKAAIAAALGAKVEEPAGPQGTPEERHNQAIDAGVNALAKSNRALGSAFPEALASGYKLPPNIEFDSEGTVRDLAAAKAAGLSQQQVDRMIKSRMNVG